jgi:hypothetical protein
MTNAYEIEGFGADQTRDAESAEHAVFAAGTANWVGTGSGRAIAEYEVWATGGFCPADQGRPTKRMRIVVYQAR